jgi:hypothetical protein
VVLDVDLLERRFSAAVCLLFTLGIATGKAGSRRAKWRR